MKFVLTLALGGLICWACYNLGTVKGIALAASNASEHVSDCVKQCNATPPGATAKK